MIAKLDIGPRGAVVTFAESGFPDLAGLLGYIERLKGAAKLRPDSKLVVARDWPTPRRGWAARCSCRRGLARVAAAGEADEGAGAGLGGFGLRRGDEPGQLLLVSAPGAKEALVEVAAPVGEQHQLGGAFDAFDDHLQVRARGQGGSSTRTTIRSRSPVTMLAISPRSIFSMSSGRLVEIGEARIAGAEIVDRDLRRPASRRLRSRSATASWSLSSAFSVISTVTRLGSMPDGVGPRRAANRS